MEPLTKIYWLTCLAMIIWLVITAPLLMYGSVDNARWQLQLVIEALL